MYIKLNNIEVLIKLIFKIMKKRDSQNLFRKMTKEENKNMMWKMTMKKIKRKISKISLTKKTKTIIIKKDRYIYNN